MNLEVERKAVTASSGSASVRVLATDLDGTFLPLGELEENAHDLRTVGNLIQDLRLCLVFVTGRHLASVKQAMQEYSTPKPEWIVGDVGSTIYERCGELYQPMDAYADCLQEIVGDFGVERLRDLIADPNSSLRGLPDSLSTAIRLQEDEKQGRFKLSYYADASKLPDITQRLEDLLAAADAPYSMIVSVDPFNGDGLVDFLPVGVSKAFALDWWTRRMSWERTNVVFAGDSGNDSAAFAHGFLTVVVGNAAEEVRRRARDSHDRNAWEGRLYAANKHATSGVLEGLRHFIRQVA